MYQRKIDEYGVIKFIEDNGGIENFRCFVYMPCITEITATPPITTYAMSGNEFNWYECKINESKHRVKEGYKITLEYTDPILFKYRETFYQSDFSGMIKDGWVIPIKGNEHLEQIQWAEPIENTSAMLMHSAWIINKGE